MVDALTAVKKTFSLRGPRAAATKNYSPENLVHEIGGVFGAQLFQ
jgi:hypothetical protein